MNDQPDARRYTVAELIDALQDVPSDKIVEVYSGCHSCGGPYLELGIYGDTFQIVGNQTEEGC